MTDSLENRPARPKRPASHPSSAIARRRSWAGLRSAAWIRPLVLIAVLSASAPVQLAGVPLQSQGPDSAVAADLAALIDAQGVSGYESRVCDLIRQSLPAWAEPRRDEIGNLVVTVGSGSPHTLIAASLDEDGHVISGITSDGYLRLHRVGASPFRLADQFLYGQPVVVQASGGRLVPGVAGTASTHLLRGAQASTALRGPGDLWIDVGASSRADVERLGIRMLDAVGLRERSTRLAGRRVAGVAAQARGGALALLAAMAGTDRPAVPSGTLTVAWTAQGVVGDRGLARLLTEARPDRLVLITRTPSGRGENAAGETGRLGGGPLVGAASQSMVDAAGRIGITVQAALQAKAPQVASTVPQIDLLALPVVYAQTPVETVSSDDLVGLARLLRAMLGIADQADPWGRGPVVRSPAAPRPAVAAARAAGGASREAAAPGSPSPWDGVPEPSILATMRPLVEAYGVAGGETPVRQVVASLLPSWAKPEVDEHGNLTVTFGKGPRELAFVAHTDEIGYEVTAVLDDGSAAVRKRGGFMDALMEGHPVVVHTAGGVVPAVVAPRAGYPQAAEWQPKADQVRLVFGTAARAETEALGVAIGDTATVRKRLDRLYPPRVTARSLDDRAGCAVLIEALKRIDPATVTSRVTFAWVIGEETGLVGSRQIASHLSPEFAFAVDTFVSSDSPLDDQRLALIPLGSGAVLRGMDGASITPPEALTRIGDLAARHGIPVTIGVTGGGTDSSSFTRVGAIPMPLSWPGRYSHSAVEVADARDLDALTRLVVALATVF